MQARGVKAKRDAGFLVSNCAIKLSLAYRGLGGVVGLTLPMARADRGSRPVYYLPCSDLGQVVNLSLSVA